MYAIKAAVRDSSAASWTFKGQKTMYGGKRIRKGDEIFVFASENEGGCGLVASGVVSSAAGIPRRVGIARQTPRVSITVKRTGSTRRRLGRSELKPFAGSNDERPESELHFRFYRQATNKIIGLTEGTAAFLGTFFKPE